ncbi:hypothetical protein HD806DRAFT_544087 [Xylariaceae sp. AK1471]|nr:hypothetical protein HD806DRAFT_544087 [Xylariaceae sp. AK1471]
MDQDPESRPSPIGELPVELVRSVLSALPDITSLKTAVLSCPLFYYTFLEAETTITMQVLLNEIGISVLPEAIAAYESSRVRSVVSDPICPEAIVDFLNQNFSQRLTPPRCCSLQKALQLERLHLCVDGFAQKFASAALAEHPIDRSESLATYEETCRIERALYRFEIYCNLFSKPRKVRPYPWWELPEEPDPIEQKKLFFDKFAPWENEQLGCIHDFLFRIISPAFNDLVEHDVDWGAWEVEYCGEVDAPEMQHVLSRGLAKLHAIAGAETYEERHQVLDAYEIPDRTSEFLHDDFQYANKPNDDIWFQGLTPEEEALLTGQPFFADPESGPVDIWRWAYDDQTWSSWVYQHYQHDLRQWGYVMWDRSRLEAVSIFQKPFDWEEGRRYSILRLEEAHRQRRLVDKSKDKALVIRRNGGTGWWSWGDLSKVKWRDEKPPEKKRLPGREAFDPPSSLAEARDMCIMMRLELFQRWAINDP